MKPYFAVVCIVIAWAKICFAQSPLETDLYEDLANGEIKALETVLKTPSEHSALILYMGSGLAFKEKRLEDSAFLFYAGQLRARFDQKCFPPVGTGGDSPFLAYTAHSQRLGSMINPAVMAEPKTFAKALHRIKQWSPTAPKGYSPGYEFKERLSEKEAVEATEPSRTEFLSRMGELSKLLNDAEYFAAFKVVQAFNHSSNEERPTRVQFEKATETMKRIEKNKGLKGFSSK